MKQKIYRSRPNLEDFETSIAQIFFPDRYETCYQGTHNSLEIEKAVP